VLCIFSNRGFRQDITGGFAQAPKESGKTAYSRTAARRVLAVLQETARSLRHLL
jgi:hypothetical protein